MNSKPYLAAATLAFTAGLGAAWLHAAERFDHKVRNDFFAGFAGDRKALDRGMTAAADAIAADPNHAEALVWHGAGLYYQAGSAFQTGDAARGMELYGKALAQMDKAVALAPDSIGVRIPRGAAFFAGTASQPVDDRVRGEIRRAVEDYERAYELQKNHLEKLGEHPLGQLLIGLGDGYSRLGNQEKAAAYFAQIEQLIPGTEWARRAAAWKEAGSLTVAQRRCVGCHVSK